jgi:hypothetical protein
VLTRVDQLEAAMAPWSAGRYRSFCLNPTSPENAFPTAACERLREIKAEVDTHGLFLSNQPISG